MVSDRASTIAALSRRIQHLARVWRQEADSVLARIGLSYATAQPLLLVDSLGSAPRQNALAALLGIEGPSLVRLLDQLSAAGLLTRSDDPSDRRAKVIHLTPDGSAVVGVAEPTLQDLRESLTADVSDEDMETTLRVLNTIAAALERRQAPA